MLAVLAELDAELVGTAVWVVVVLGVHDAAAEVDVECVGVSLSSLFSLALTLVALVNLVALAALVAPAAPIFVVEHDDETLPLLGFEFVVVCVVLYCNCNDTIDCCCNSSFPLRRAQALTSTETHTINVCEEKKKILKLSRQKFERKKKTVGLCERA